MTTIPSDSGIDIPPSASTDKEVAIPHGDTDKEMTVPNNNTDKQVFSRTDDSSKEVRSPETDTDTSKQAIPKLPPISMEKEIAPPTNNEDKQLTSTLSRKDSIGLSRTNALCAFRVEKFNPLGLILPQDQKLSLRGIDPRTGADMGQVFMTGEMSWVDVVSVLPPMFELFRCGGGQGGMTMELVARSIPRGWEGVSGVRVEIEVSCYDDGNDGRGGGGGVRREKWEIDRRGLGRNYKLRKEGEKEEAFVWKGTSSSVKELVSSGEGTGERGKGKKEKVHKGNLKLVEKEKGEVLAVWQQARDSNVLGDLIIFEATRGKMGPELIVTTCLTAVNAERASGMNWFGGFGK